MQVIWKFQIDNTNDSPHLECEWLCTSGATFELLTCCHEIPSRK